MVQTKSKNGRQQPCCRPALPGEGHKIISLKEEKDDFFYTNLRRKAVSSSLNRKNNIKKPSF